MTGQNAPSPYIQTLTCTAKPLPVTDPPRCPLLTAAFVAALSYLADTASAAAADTPAAALVTTEAQATAGDPAAQFRLGTFYYIGLGAEQDWAVAVQWLRKAAGQGDAEAQCELGMIYQIGGDGVVQDIPRP